MQILHANWLLTCDENFTIIKNGAIVFDENDRVPIDALKHCIELSLSYHKIKHLPMLGL